MARQKKKYLTKFQKWVKDYGYTRLAYDLGTTESCVRNWMHGNLPKDSHKVAIVNLAKGAIAYEDFFEMFK